jgi:hypothetical protein
VKVVAVKVVAVKVVAVKVVVTAATDKVNSLMFRV